MYNPAGGENDEFIELYNPSATEYVDMSGWQLDGVELTIPPGTVLLPQSYLVVVKNDVQFRATYGSGIFVAAQYKGNLDNAGENLVLKDRQGNVIDEVQYEQWRILAYLIRRAIAGAYRRLAEQQPSYELGGQCFTGRHARRYQQHGRNLPIHT